MEFITDIPNPPPDLLRPKPHLELHHVGALHARTDCFAINHQSIYHQHLGQFLRHRSTGNDCV